MQQLEDCQNEATDRHSDSIKLKKCDEYYCNTKLPGILLCQYAEMEQKSNRYPKQSIKYVAYKCKTTAFHNQYHLVEF